MILYALTCGDGHTFEAWFRDSVAFEDQIAARKFECPICASPDVRKAIMAPAVRHSASRPAEKAEPKPAERTSNVALLDDASREMRGLLRKVRDKLLTEGQDVGRTFAEEARRIHEGTAPKRQIYGQASLIEARELLEDGIEVLPMPIVPDDLN